MSQPTPGQARVAKAVAARKRKMEDRYAALLAERGWTVTTPEGQPIAAPTRPDSDAA